MNRKSGDLPGYASRIFFDGKEGEGPRCVFFISATLPFYMKRRFFYVHWQFLNKKNIWRRYMTGKVNEKAILLLGHGSKAPEANETLRKVAASVKAAGGYGAVLPAFLQMAKPDFQEGVDELVSMGFNEIILMPYFLYMGLHVTQDLPEEMDKALARYPGLTLTFAKNLGYHDKLVDITVERIGAALGCPEVASRPAALTQHPIERESFRIISGELDEASIPADRLPVVKRVIHSTADFEFKDMLSFSPGAIKAGVAAIRSGRSIITDVRMVEAGITPARLAGFGAKVMCFVSDADVAAGAKTDGTTRTAAAMKKAASHMGGGIVAIGNAPTALTELIRLIKDGAAPPALVVGVPVGFVGAVEAKEELVKSGLEYITTCGRKGGSTVAAAIVNAIAIEAAGAGV